MNACYSETQADARAHAVGSVVAMEGLVSDPGAIESKRAFYSTDVLEMGSHPIALTSGHWRS
jgi:hypothetical protein